MTALYIASWTEGAGKTALCAGIGRHLQDKGKKVGYLKPVALAEEGTDRDAQFMKQVLELKEPVEAPQGRQTGINQAYQLFHENMSWLLLQCHKISCHNNFHSSKVQVFHLLNIA